MANVWLPSAVSGLSLAVISERTPVSMPLPVKRPALSTFKVISGKLPAGLYIDNDCIVGTPFEVATATTSTFVIRATDEQGHVSDRTFSITVEGADNPLWITPAGNLDITNNSLAFVLDNSYVDFQLVAIDSDLAAGQGLEYFIEDGAGELPPGLTLSKSGRITGIIPQILALDTVSEGFFDTDLFGGRPFDYGQAADTGLDTFLYDSYNYDFSSPVRAPRKLNRNYEFTVTVSDGAVMDRRTFRIFVVGDDFVRTDNTLSKIGDNVFTADSTFLRPVYWLTSADLGVKRANNYATIILDTFDPNPAVGPVVYELAEVNADGSSSQLPPGLSLDPTTGEIFGYLPYLPAITETYQFTVNAIKYNANAFTQVEINVELAEPGIYGQHHLKVLPLSSTEVQYLVGSSIKVLGYYYSVIGYQTPDELNEPYGKLLLKENLYFTIPVTTVINKQYIESVPGASFITAPRQFTMQVMGEVESTITWTTPADFGVVRANIPSTLVVRAVTSVPRATVYYKLDSGELPPGLTLMQTGELAGTIRQFETGPSSPGITRFVSNNIAAPFDQGKTTFDSTFRFTVQAVDQFRYSSVFREFTITVDTSDPYRFSNVYAQPMQSVAKRQEFKNFITDSNIFTPSKIYKASDPNFGVRQDLRMLVYAGIETVKAEEYIAALATNARRTRVTLGEVKKAVGKLPGKSSAEYEVVYIEVLDRYQFTDQNVATKIRIQNATTNYQQVNQAGYQPLNSNADVDWFRPVNTSQSADATTTLVNDSAQLYAYPSSIAGIRENIRSRVINNRQIDTEREYLPYWMTASQDAKTPALGFVTAIPLCYCLPGEADYVIANIRNSGFDFKSIDFEIDRLIISGTLDNLSEQYLLFRNYKYNI